MRRPAFWRRSIFAGTVVLAVLLSGCVTTVFESPPGDRTAACDTRWVGAWQVHRLDPATRDEEGVVLTVEPGCSALHVSENGKLQHDLDHAKVLFAEVEKISILAVRIRQTTARSDARSTDWSDGYHYFAYVVGTDEIRVRQVDDERIATLIGEDKLAGRSERITRYPGAHQRSERSNLQNFVAGSAQDMAQAIAAYPLFFDKGAIILKRIANSPAQPKSTHPSNAKKTNPP